jgi:programmed cell death protein 4
MALFALLVQKAPAMKIRKTGTYHLSASMPMTCCIILQVISTAQMQKGFRKLLLAVMDLKLDVPEAPHQIATFIARAVVDDVLPASFVDDIPGGQQPDIICL